MIKHYAMKPDITTRKDIEQLVNAFYGQVQTDDLIGPIFNGVIQDRWPVHLQKMYSFWETVLLGNHTYSGAPFMPHARLPLEQQHFNRWLHLFDKTLDTMFSGPVADDAKARAAKMAVMFLSKIDSLKEHGSFRPLY
jgi:hemoglobin